MRRTHCNTCLSSRKPPREQFGCWTDDVWRTVFAGHGILARTVRSRSLRAGLIVTAITVLLGFGVAEAAVRWKQPVPVGELLPLPFQPIDYDRLAVGDSYLWFDQDLGWSQRPGARAVDDGIVYQANGAGFRADREYRPEPPPGVRRLAAFGDSFTHCDEVNLQDCWTARLEAAWERSEVLNFGIQASAPDQGWLRYQRDGRPYHPCAVLVGFQVENVNRVVNRYRPFYSPRSGVAFSKPRYVLEGAGLRLLPNPVAGPGQLDDPAWVERTLGPDDFWYFPGLFAPSPLDRLMLARLTRSALYRQHRTTLEGERTENRPNGRAYTPEDERFQVSGRVLVQFAREVQTDGATPVVLFFGQRDEVVSVRHDQPKEYQPLLDWLAAEEIPVLDVTDDLAREANRVGTDTLFARNGHYSRRGNQTIGTALAQRLPRLTSATCG